jgi:ribosomal protein S18 acetylase RimI-like enzyme
MSRTWRTIPFVKIVCSTAHLEPQLASAREYWCGFARAGRTDGYMTLYRSDVPDRMYNGVLRVHSGHVEDLLDEVRPQLAGVPWTWWVGPDSRDDLAKELLANGARQFATLPIMAVELDRVVDTDGPSNLHIEEVEDLEVLQEWVQVYGLSLGVHADHVAAVASLEANRPDTAGEVVRFAGRINGQIVGTSMLLNSHGVAGIHVVATREEFRGCGIGTRLTAAALRAGQARGLKVGTLQATDLGAPLYRRMGFRTVSEYRLFTFQEH